MTDIEMKEDKKTSNVEKKMRLFKRNLMTISMVRIVNTVIPMLIIYYAVELKKTLVLLEKASAEKDFR